MLLLNEEPAGPCSETIDQSMLCYLCCAPKKDGGREKRGESASGLFICLVMHHTRCIFRSEIVLCTTRSLEGAFKRYPEVLSTLMKPPSNRVFIL